MRLEEVVVGVGVGVVVVVPVVPVVLVIVAAVVVALILLAGVACLVAKEKAGKPLFTSLDAPASNA